MKLGRSSNFHDEALNANVTNFQRRIGQVKVSMKKCDSFTNESLTIKSQERITPQIAPNILRDEVNQKMIT